MFRYFQRLHTTDIEKDAYSPFNSRGDLNALENNREVSEATDRLFKTIIPACAEEISKVPEEIWSFDTFTRTIHSHGVNIRFNKPIFCLFSRVF